MEMRFDFGAYVARRKGGVSGERGEGYAFEGDLALLRTMRKLRPLELAVGQTVKLSKSLLAGGLLGTSVRVGPRQFPRVHRIVEDCARTLGIAMPQVFINPSIATINAFTFGTDEDAAIVIHAAMFEHLTDDEIRFVVGHECGHVQNNHVVYLSTLKYLEQILSLTGGLLTPRLRPATVALQGWSRAAEITCDRAGLLCVRDPAVGASALAKLGVGSKRLFEELDVDVYLEQLGEARESMGRVNELAMTHPYVTKRIEALRLFGASELYRKAAGLSGGLSRDELERRTAEVIKVM